MSLYLEERGNFREWDGREKIRGISYQPNIGDLWSDDELAAINLYRPVVPPVPFGKVVTRKTVQRVNSVVTFVYTLESAPLKDLNRIQFRFMVKKLRMAAKVEAAIAALPEGTEQEQNEKILAETLWEDGDRFERAHPLFMRLAPAVGITAEEIDAAWQVALTI